MTQCTLTEEMSRAVDAAVEALKAGGLVAVPTETVYGLAADADNPAAVRSTFTAKGRPADHPLIVHVTGSEALKDWAVDIPEAAYKLAEAFWPGPLTMVLKRSERVSDAVTGGQDTVAIRAPAHPLMRELLLRFSADGSRAVTAPSANTFGRISPTCAKHVADDLGLKPEGKLDCILDGGDCRVGVESTIVNLTSPEPEILRYGAVTRAMLEGVLGCRVREAGENAPRTSGRLKSHYAPQTKLEIVPAGDLAARFASVEGGKAALLLIHADPARFTGAVKIIQAPGDAAGYAHSLYASLHELDACGAVRIFAEKPPADDVWAAVNDRLTRAAADKTGH